MKTIGILAGMGPRSTAPFLELVLDECQNQYGAKYDDEYPPIIIYSLPTPYYLDKPMNQSDLEKAVCDGAKRLVSVGVDFIALPANSVHAFFPSIQAAAGIPVLNIVDETVKRIPTGVLDVAIIATRMTHANRLYDTGLKKRDIHIVDTSKLQVQVDELIASMKEVNDKSIAMFKHLIQEYKAAGAKAVIVACTDLTPLTLQESDLPIVDSSRCLAQEVVLRYKGSQD